MDSSYLTLCVLNAYLSYTATMMNIVTIYAIRKTSSLSKNLKTLLLSLAVSDLGVGLLAQPIYVAYLVMDSKQNNKNSESYNAIYIASLFPTNVFFSASLFSVMALSAERFVAIHLHLRYQELVTHKRVAAAVILMWVFSGLFSVIRFWIPTNITYVIFGVAVSACIITATFLSVKIYLSVRRHINHIQVLQAQQVSQHGQTENQDVDRKRKSAIASVYIYLVFTICYLPNICLFLIIAAISESRIDVQHLQFYTLTLQFLNSSLNPLIYCWNLKQIRHTVIGTLRDVFSSHT